MYQSNRFILLSVNCKSILVINLSSILRESILRHSISKQIEWASDRARNFQNRLLSQKLIITYIFCQNNFPNLMRRTLNVSLLKKLIKKRWNIPWINELKSDDATPTLDNGELVGRELRVALKMKVRAEGAVSELIQFAEEP